MRQVAESQTEKRANDPVAPAKQEQQQSSRKKCEPGEAAEILRHSNDAPRQYTDPRQKKIDKYSDRRPQWIDRHGVLEKFDITFRIDKGIASVHNRSQQQLPNDHPDEHIWGKITHLHGEKTPHDNTQQCCHCQRLDNAPQNPEKATPVFKS